MIWSVEYLNESVVGEANALAPDQRARLQRVIELIQAFGPERIQGPHLKHLQRGLWEIRLSGRSGIGRAIYVTARCRRLVIVRVFVKKSRKTPPHELRMALERAKEVE